MSNNVGSPAPLVTANPAWSIAGPSSYALSGPVSAPTVAQLSPATAQSGPTPAFYSSDQIAPKMEALGPPLMPSAGGNAATADAFANAQGAGMFSVAVLAGVLTVVAAVGVPVIMEFGHRQRAQHEMRLQNSEHEVHGMILNARDSTRHWIRHIEEQNVDAPTISALSALMNTHWDAFLDAQTAYNKAFAEQKAPPSEKLETVLKDAYTAVRELGIPVELRPLPVYEEGSPNTKLPANTYPQNPEHPAHVRLVPTVMSRESLDPESALKTLVVYHGVLRDLKDVADSDNRRLLQQQTASFINLICNENALTAAELKRGGAAPYRSKELNKKLLTTHSYALVEFKNRRFGMARP